MIPRRHALSIALGCLALACLVAASVRCEGPEWDGCNWVTKDSRGQVTFTTSMACVSLPLTVKAPPSLVPDDETHDLVWRGEKLTQLTTPIEPDILLGGGGAQTLQLGGSGAYPCARYAWTPPTWTYDYRLCGGCQVSPASALLPSNEMIRAVQEAVLAYLQRQAAEGRLEVRRCGGWDLALGWCHVDPWPYVRLPEVAWVEGWSICDSCFNGATGESGQLCFAGMTDFNHKPATRIVISTCQPARTLPLVAWETAHAVIGQTGLRDSNLGWGETMYDGPWVAAATAAALAYGK